MTRPDTLERNIACRREAEAVIELAGQQPARFWETLIQLAEERLPPKPVPVDPYPPMADDEAAKFERWVMPYGKHGGKPMGDIPVGYMCWLTDGDDVVKAARRYVRSKRFSERQDAETPQDFDEEYGE